MSDALESLRELIRDEIRREVRAQLHDRDLLDQAHSPLGRRRHIALARRLIETGDGRATKVGRRYLIERGALIKGTTTPKETSSPLPQVPGFGFEPAE